MDNSLDSNPDDPERSKRFLGAVKEAGWPIFLLFMLPVGFALLIALLVKFARADNIWLWLIPLGICGEVAVHGFVDWIRNQNRNWVRNQKRKR